MLIAFEVVEEYIDAFAKFVFITLISSAKRLFDVRDVCSIRSMRDADGISTSRFARDSQSSLCVNHSWTRATHSHTGYIGNTHQINFSLLFYFYEPTLQREISH